MCDGASSNAPLPNCRSALALARRSGQSVAVCARGVSPGQARNSWHLRAVECRWLRRGAGLWTFAGDDRDPAFSENRSSIGCQHHLPCSSAIGDGTQRARRVCEREPLHGGIGERSRASQAEQLSPEVDHRVGPVREVLE